MMETSTGQGGLWSCCPRGQYSKDTQELLKLMMQESRLTNFQQRQINERLKIVHLLPLSPEGTSLPLTLNPTSSAPPTQPAPKIIKSGPEPWTKSQRRSADQCSSGNNYVRERFLPSATRDLEKEKRRLQNLLATGQEEPSPSPPRKDPAGPGAEEEERDRFQEVLDEIEERRRFLEEMTALGKGNNYYNLINTEISQKCRELKLMDRARSEELRSLLTSEEEAGLASEETGQQD